MISTAVLAVLALIEQIIPLLGSSSSSVALIDNIINTLVKLMPYIIDEVTVVYTAVKNIITQVMNKGDPTQAQRDALAELDTQVDAAWTAIEAQIDPDAGATGA